MPFTLTGRSVLFILLIALGAAVVGFLAYLAVNFFYWMLGHRSYIPWAKALRFKRDDMVETEKKVEDILGEENAGKKKTKSKTKKSQ